MLLRDSPGLLTPAGTAAHPHVRRAAEQLCGQPNVPHNIPMHYR